MCHCSGLCSLENDFGISPRSSVTSHPSRPPHSWGAPPPAGWARRLASVSLGVPVSSLSVACVVQKCAPVWAVYIK